VTPVSVGELNTEVVAEPPPAEVPSGPSAGAPWEELDRLRQTAAELMRLHDRTHAEGFDA